MFEAGTGTLSRLTRDEGAPVEVCPRCDSRESVYGYDPRRHPPMTEWPLSPETLANEERALITAFQKAKMEVRYITPEDARRMLDDQNDNDDSDDNAPS